MEYKHIAFLVMSEATLLDITGPYEVFNQALECIKATGANTKYMYQLHTLSAENTKSVRTASGLKMQCDDFFDSFNYQIDTLFVPGVPNSLQEDYRLKKKILDWIATQSATVRRVCSVCTGTFFLAEAGILNNRRATTHWEMCSKLAENYPDVSVDKDSIFVRDGNIYTSAGISSGMDLALSLVEEDYGRDLSLDVARQMVLYLKRQGSQSQFSSVLKHQATDYRPVQDIEDWIIENLNNVITVEKMAERVSMSPRNFARVFVRETGITPARYVDKVRIERACWYLAESQWSLKEIAEKCGLGNPDNMRRVFLKYIHTTPMEYRRNFNPMF